MLTELETLIDSLQSGNTEDGKSPLGDLGLVSCASRLDIRHVPFYDPCLILVLRGSKTLFEHTRAIRCPAGSAIAVPGPASYDIRNEPDRAGGRYKALIVPFRTEHLSHLVRTHGLVHAVPGKPAGVIAFGADRTLTTSIAHYLGTVGNPRLLSHRLMEILLVLVTLQPVLLSYSLRGENWAGRLRTVLGEDIAHPWTMGEVCRRLATTESTLRRNLKDEGTGFRDVLAELRLASALNQLLQTTYPVYRVAYDCGFQSVSRFTANFRKRFGVLPSDVRRSVDETGRKLTGSGQP